jgi:hypothetical protein
MRAPNVLFSGLALLLFVGAAPDPESAGGRYKLTPVEGGAFLRLDTQTGVVSVCQRKDANWACAAVPDDRRALESEIGRLATENKELQGSVKRLEELLALPDPEGTDKRALRGPKIQLPSEADVDWAMDYVQRMMRKFKDRMRDFKNDDRRNL